MTEFQFLLLLVVVHVVGLVAVGVLMIPVLRDPDEAPREDDEDGSDDGWGNRPNEAPKPSRWPGGGIPLPDADQSHVRLREPGHIHEKLPSPERRPVHPSEPSRQPVRTFDDR